MLDNMLPSEMRQAIALIDGQYETEASGGITEKEHQRNRRNGCQLHLNVGALTHSYKSLDMSLKAI